MWRLEPPKTRSPSTSHSLVHYVIFPSACSPFFLSSPSFSFSRLKKKIGEVGYRSQYLPHAKRSLYHLSYIPTPAVKKKEEPATQRNTPIAPAPPAKQNDTTPKPQKKPAQEHKRSEKRLLQPATERKKQRKKAPFKTPTAPLLPKPRIE